MRNKLQTYIHRKSGDEEGMKRIKDRPSRVDVESRKAKLLCEGAIWNLLGMCVNIFLLKTKTSQLKKKKRHIDQTFPLY